MTRGLTLKRDAILPADNGGEKIIVEIVTCTNWWRGKPCNGQDFKIYYEKDDPCAYVYCTRCQNVYVDHSKKEA